MWGLCTIQYQSSPTYIWNLADIYDQEHMPMMGNVYLHHIVDCSKFVCSAYTSIVVSGAHELVGVYCISMTFEGHIYCWHIYGYVITTRDPHIWLWHGK